MLTRILIILWVVVSASVLCLCFWGEDDIKLIWWSILMILMASCPIWWGLLVRELWDSDSKIFHIIWVIIFLIVMVICFTFFDRNE